MFGFAFFGLVIVLVIAWQYNKRKKITKYVLPVTYSQLLKQHVAFYQHLNPEQQTLFLQKAQHFLARVRITGVGPVVVEDIDRVLVAASAIIPIFGFPTWDYRNLTDVLLYGDTFNEAFETSGQHRAIAGMVGSGYMEGKMILSQPSLREGFDNSTDKHNTGIHEFVHLLDKSDGAVDGIPENLLSRPYLIPWVDLMHKTIQEIRDHHSDINPYGATNQGEFFAVVSEYFFERPDLFKTHHPELFELMEKIFHQELT